MKKNQISELRNIIARRLYRNRALIRLNSSSFIDRMYYVNNTDALYEIRAFLKTLRKENQRESIPTIVQWYEATINSPIHYTQGGIECIDYLKAKLTSEEFIGFLKGNVIKYLSRANIKGGIEDYKKAQWYVNKLIEVLK